MNITETLTQIIKKIIEIRKEKGLTLENIAEDLGISVAAYNKIEKQETKLTYERLLQIQIALGVKLNEILGIKTENIYNQKLNDYAVGHQEIENLYQDNRILTEKYITSLNEEIAFLKTSLSKLI